MGFMFACIYDRTVLQGEQDDTRRAALLDLAFTFSPLVEQTTSNTVVLDISGQDLLFGSGFPNEPYRGDGSYALGNEIFRHANQLGLSVNVSVAGNPDTAIHSARVFETVTLIPAGSELLQLGDFPLRMLDCSLAGIERQRSEEIR